MRIRTRYQLFKGLMALAVLVFLASLYDMFQNDSGWELYVLIAYGALALGALLLYIGHKPDLFPERVLVSEVVAATEGAPLPEGDETAVEVVEVSKNRPLPSLSGLQGPHPFKCPFCANLFLLEATHAERAHDLRMQCPYCANAIRVPRRPHVARGNLKRVRHAAPTDRALYACAHCGEVLRVTAPASAWERFLTITSCPHCQSRRVVPAATA